MKHLCLLVASGLSLALALCAPSHACTVTMGGTSYLTIQDAVNAAPMIATIQVDGSTGVCYENVLIPNVTLRMILSGVNHAWISGTFTSPTVDARVKGFMIQGFTVDGGYSAIQIQRNANAIIDSDIVQNSYGDGIVVDSMAFAVITNSRIQNNAGAGIRVGELASARIGADFPEDDGVTAPNLILSNGGDGIAISEKATAQIIQNDISNNGGNGISVSASSSAATAGNLINGNAYAGVYALERSYVNLGMLGASVQPDATTTANQLYGVACYAGAAITGYLNQLNPLGGSMSQFSYDASCPRPSTALAQASAPPNSTVWIVVTPGAPVVQTFASQQFSAMVNGMSNTSVTWQISCSAGGAACGAISAAGLYQAPNSVPIDATPNGAEQGRVTVTAVSQANPSVSGSEEITIESLNQQAQSMPIELGASGGNANQNCSNECESGTLGSLLTRAGQQFILTNNHVGARSDGGSLGDSIIEPGLIDIGCSAAAGTQVGTLSQFFNLQSGSGIPVDAAIAQVVSGTVDTTGAILGLGSTVVSGVPQPGAPAQGSGAPASIGEMVAKSGRSTGVTCAPVEAIDSTVDVSYMSACSTSSFTTTFSNQITIGGAGFSAHGDSGSLVVDSGTATPVGLLFAGGDTTTIANPVADVLSAMADSSGNRPTFVGGAVHTVAACSLPAPVAAAAVPQPRIAQAALARAREIRDRHAPEVLTNPSVTGLGVGASLDAPGQAAIVIFVGKSAGAVAFPAEIEGARTRVVYEDSPEQSRSLTAEETASRIQSAGRSASVSLSPAQVEQARGVKESRVAELMTDPAIRGVGVGASLDAPGEPSLVIYLLQDHPDSSIPAALDEVRTRIVQTTGFWAGKRGAVSARDCKGEAKGWSLPAARRSSTLPAMSQ